MNQRPNLLLVAALMMIAIPILEGCGDDEPRNQIRRRARPKAAKKRVVRKTGSVNMDKVPRRLRNIDWSTSDKVASQIRGSRDPFYPYIDDLRVKAEDEKDKQVTKIRTAAADNEVGDLTFKAAVTGTAVHTAMLEDGRGLGHFLRAGDVVGRKIPMRLVRITRNEVIFKALEKPADDKTPTVVRKTLLNREELQELLP